MGIGREPVPVGLLAEAVQVVLVQPPLEEGAGVDAGGGVPLDVDEVAPCSSVGACQKWLNPTS